MNRKTLTYIFIFFSLCLNFSSSHFLYAEENKEQKKDLPKQEEHVEKHVDKQILPSFDHLPGYTINFQNVSILEYLNFISKIAKVNLIYKEEDLNFNVTILSEEPTNLVNIMAALTQVLKINGLSLIEQGNNLLISQAGTANQIATVVSTDTPLKEGEKIPPIITYVFKAKKANPNTLGQMIRPFLSKGGMLEISNDTRHLIITDITQNIEEIKKLLVILDAPEGSLEIASFFAKHNSPDSLISLTKQIITPLAEGNTFILVSQSNKNLIYIVSTPFLIQKTKSILDDLDSFPQKALVGPITSANILFYHIKNKPADIIESALKKIETHLATLGSGSDSIVDTLKTMKYIKESHSLFFTGSPSSLAEISVMLNKIDIPYTSEEIEHSKSGYLVYKIKNGDEAQIARSLEKFVANMKLTEHPNTDLIQAIHTMKWIKENNSLIFNGDPKSIEKLKQLLPSFDTPSNEGKTANKLPLSDKFYVYKPKYLSGEILLKHIQDTYKNLKESGLSDPAFLHTLNTGKWVPVNQSLIFTGDPGSIARLKKLLTEMDSSAGGTEVYVYKVKYIEPEAFEKSLKHLALSLPPGSPLEKIIANLKHVKTSQSFVFNGTPAAIKSLQEILPTIDNVKAGEEESEGKPVYFVYKLKSASGSKVLAELVQTADSFKTSDEKVYTVIKEAKWLESTNSIVLIGTQGAVEKVKTMIAKFDTTQPIISTFFVYKPKTISVGQLKIDVLQSAENLKSSGLQNPELISALESIQVDNKNNSVTFTGTEEAINKVKSIVDSYDSHKEASAYFVYKPQHISAQQLKTDAFEAAAGLENSGLKDPALIQALKSAHVDSKNNHVTFSGTEEAIAKIQPILKSYDTSRAEVKTNHFYIFKPTHQSPDYIIEEANHTASKMHGGGLANTELIEALRSGSIVSNGTAVLFTGTAKAIESIKGVVENFDTVKKEKVKATDFYVYHPTHISADELRRHARIVAGEMESSNFSDPELIKTLQSSQLVSNGKSVLFTGTTASIVKLKDLLPSLDTTSEDSIKHLGDTTFQIYKIKHISAMSLMQHLRNVATDISRTSRPDLELAKTINNMRYVKESNSIVFTGTKAAVSKALMLAEKFDTETEDLKPKKPPTTFSIYKPKYLPGKELIHHVKEFEQNLVTSGVNDQGLFDTIKNMRWMEKNSHILISGEKEDVDKTISLLERFDVAAPGIPKSTEDVETISELSFLVYKLQYHSGPEIKGAIMGVGEDLKASKSKENEKLVDAIKSLQYIELTNSLIATGDPAALKKLKELIKSIDVPQKQVFVEVLVIQTTLADSLEFSLNWGSQGNFQDKFVYNSGNFSNNTGLIDGLNKANSKGPLGESGSSGSGDILLPGVDGGGVLGVIGDIITHQGNSYFSLGSLLTAVERDSQTTVILNQKLITQDNKNSTLFIGQNIPYAGSVVQNNGSGNQLLTQNIEYRDIGVNLSITPTVGLNNTITLDISQDISNNTDGATAIGDNLTGITTSKNTVQTVVTVPNNAFVAVSGQVDNSILRQKSGVPCLGGLPLIGAAFNDVKNTQNTANIVMFIRPSVMTSFETYKETTERQEEIFKSMTNDPEDFEFGLELLKTPEDAE